MASSETNIITGSNIIKYYNDIDYTKIDKRLVFYTSDLLSPGIVGQYRDCAELWDLPINIIDGSKLSGEAAKMFNEAQVHHNIHYHFIKGQKYDVVVSSENKFFLRKQGDKAIENVDKLTYTTTITDVLDNKETTNTLVYNIEQYDNIAKIDNENIKPSTAEEFVKEDVFENAIIILNIDKNLCTNKSVCYLKFDIINNQNIYKTIYVKYDNSLGLLNKQLYKFDFENNNEKEIINLGFIKITAYQLSDLTDNNPYIIGTFSMSKLSNKSKFTTLYKFIEINDAYNFTFDIISIYPINISGQTYKINNDHISIYENGNIINNENLIKVTYSYILDWNYVHHTNYNDITTFDIQSIIIYIDNNEMWNEYDKYYCNIIFYVKNGNNVILPNNIFKKLGNKLILSTSINFVDNIHNIYDNIVKFSITSISVDKSDQKIKLKNTSLSTQGNIINKFN